MNVRVRDDMPVDFLIESTTTHDNHKLVIFRDVAIEALGGSVTLAIWSEAKGLEGAKMPLGDFLRGLGLTAEDCVNALTQTPCPRI